MSTELKSMIMGGAIVAVVVGAGFGLWSMTVAPLPPSVQSARAQAEQQQKMVQGHMQEFISNWRRTRKALDKGDAERAGAHLTVMLSIAEELQGGQVVHKIPEDEIKALKASVGTALQAIKTNDPTGKDLVVGLKAQCMACHAKQNGPPPTLFND